MESIVDSHIRYRRTQLSAVLMRRVDILTVQFTSDMVNFVFTYVKQLSISN